MGHHLGPVQGPGRLVAVSWTPTGTRDTVKVHLARFELCNAKLPPEDSI
jgi:hypothetical protein